MIIGAQESLSTASLAGIPRRLNASEELAVLASAVATLPPSARQALTLRFVYGFRHGEIAEKLGMSRRTVEQHLASAARGFAEALNDTLAGEEP